MFTKSITSLVLLASLTACGGGTLHNTSEEQSQGATIDCPVIHQAEGTISHRCTVGNRVFIHHESSNALHIQMHRASLVNGRVLLVGSNQDVGDIQGNADITEENGSYTLNEYIY